MYSFARAALVEATKQAAIANIITPVGAAEGGGNSLTDQQTQVTPYNLGQSCAAIPVLIQIRHTMQENCTRK